MPMKRSRDLTMQAAISENVEKIAEPQHDGNRNARDCSDSKAKLNAEQECEDVNQNHLAKASRHRRNSPSQDQRRAIGSARTKCGWR